MSLHIIGGRFKNRSLKTPKKASVRPTLAIVRKAVFDICQAQIEGAQVLDLFAGSGAMGLEALSRGASHATFVELDRDSYRCIEENIQTLNVSDAATLHFGNALSLLKKFREKKNKFDLIYIDPPYQEEKLLSDVLHLIDEVDLLSEGGIVFVEEASPPHLMTEKLALQHLTYKDTRKFGKSVLHQFLRLL